MSWVGSWGSNPSLMMMMKETTMKWITNRMMEPSSWAAIAVICIGAAVLLDNFWVAVGGVCMSAIPLVLKERGII